MNKKILVLTMSQSQSKYEVTRLEEEARKMGVEVNKGLYKNIQFLVSNNKKRVMVNNEEITPENTMAVWFRVAGTISGKYVEGRNLLIRMLGDKIFCTNAKGYLGWPRMGKIAQHGVFIINSIPVVATKIFYTKEQILGELEEGGEIEGLGWPVIGKHDRGYQGKGVRKFENREALKKFIDKMDEINLGMFLWQKYLPTKWDLRVIVLNGRAIGAMKRTAREGEFRSNFSLGGVVEKWDLSEKDKLLAEKVAKAAGLDYGGVDIMKDEKGRSYVLEVNRQCQFQGFEKATGINVARLVVEMFFSKC